MVLFAICIFLAKKGCSNCFWAVPRRQQRRGQRFHICRLMQCNVSYGCISKKHKKKLKNQHVEKISACCINQNNHFESPFHKIRPHQFFVIKISPTVILAIFRFGVLKVNFLINATPIRAPNGPFSHLVNPL